MERYKFQSPSCKWKLLVWSRRILLFPKPSVLNVSIIVLNSYPHYYVAGMISVQPIFCPVIGLTRLKTFGEIISSPAHRSAPNMSQNSASLREIYLIICNFLFFSLTLFFISCLWSVSHCKHLATHWDIPIRFCRTEDKSAASAR